MKIDSLLMDKLPGYHVCLGLAFLGLGIVSKDNLPQTVGSLPIIQLPCAFFTAVLIPFGSLLALRALVLQSTSRRNLLSCHLLGLVFILLMLSDYFYTALLMNRVIDLPNQIPSILPKLTENARTFPNQQKRMFQAQWAYRMYGVIVAYRQDNDQVVYYAPTADDLAFWQKSDQSNRQALAQITFIKKVTAEYPYLFGLYASTYMATFAVGWIWLAVKVPKDSQRAAS